MKLIPNYLLTAACIALATFTTSRCTSQEADRLLHAGMLGFTANEDQEVEEPVLASTGRATEEETGWLDRSGAVIRYRIGAQAVRNDVMTAMLEYVGLPGILPIIGVSVEGRISDYFSTRGAFDLIYGFGTFEQNNADGSSAGIWIDGDITVLALKYTALFHPPPRTLWSSKSGYFHPYIGLGVEFNWLSLTVDVNNRADISIVYSSHSNGFGIHAVAGAEYVFDSWSIGLELAWSGVEVDFGEGDASIGVVGLTDIGGTFLLFSIGYDF